MVAKYAMLLPHLVCRQDGQNSQADLKRENQAKIKAALLENERKHFSKGKDAFEGEHVLNLRPASDFLKIVIFQC